MKKQRLNDNQNQNPNVNVGEDKRGYVNFSKYRCFPGIGKVRHKCDPIHNLQSSQLGNENDNFLFGSLQDCELKCRDYGPISTIDSKNQTETKATRLGLNATIIEQAIQNPDRAIEDWSLIQNVLEMMLNTDNADIRLIDQPDKSLTYENLLCRLLTDSKNLGIRLPYFDSTFQQIVTSFESKTSATDPPSDFLLPCILLSNKSQNFRIYFDALSSENQRLMIKLIFDNDILSNSLVPILVNQILPDYKDNQLTTLAINSWLKRNQEWILNPSTAANTPKSNLNRDEISRKLLATINLDQPLTLEQLNLMNVFRLPEVQYYYSPQGQPYPELTELENYLKFFIGVINLGTIKRTNPGDEWINNNYKNEARKILDQSWLKTNPANRGAQNDLQLIIRN